MCGFFVCAGLKLVGFFVGAFFFFFFRFMAALCPGWVVAVPDFAEWDGRGMGVFMASVWVLGGVGGMLYMT
jgi:hypothetical protein